MQPYQDRDGDQTIIGYEDGLDFIRLHYRDGAVLEFHAAEVGTAHVINLRQLARLQDGLPHYLTRFVNLRLARRIR